MSIYTHDHHSMTVTLNMDCFTYLKIQKKWLNNDTDIIKACFNKKKMQCIFKIINWRWHRSWLKAILKFHILTFSGFDETSIVNTIAQINAYTRSPFPSRSHWLSMTLTFEIKKVVMDNCTMFTIITPRGNYLLSVSFEK